MEVKSKIINDSSIISSNSEQEKQEFNQFNFYKELVKYIIIEYKKASNNQGEKVKEVKYENIEDYSLYIKKKFQSIFTIKEKPNDKSINDYSNVEKSVFLNKTKNKAKLDKVPNLVENLMAKARLLDTVGISLGKIEWLKVKKALESLVTKEVLVIKFWGKIYGKYNDYYIIQMERKENKSLITKYSPNKPDPSGIVGANQYLFYASNHLLENWIELPEVSGEQIKISRLFKYLFSGNLSAKVDSFVPFPGNEAHLLKCCILRIMHSTSIVPDGYLEIKQIDKSLETYGIELSDKITQVKEDFTLTSTNEEMSAPERWVHQYAYISDKGKIIDIVPEESPPARLQTIAQDKRKYNFKCLNC